MKKLLSVLLVTLLLLVPSFAVLAVSDDAAVNGMKANAELVDLIASGDYYLVGGGVPFDTYASSDEPIIVQWESGKNHTHQYLTARALTILQNDKGRKTAAYLTKYSSTLLANSDWPDSSENDIGLYSGHFYDPNTGLNYWGSNSPTAMTRFLIHSQNAKNNYATNKTASMQELGRALHYLADINEPHHAANLTALNSNHTAFETYADNTRANYVVNSTDFYTTLPTRDAKTDYSNYCRDIINLSAYHGLAYKDQAASSLLSANQTAAEATIEYSQQIMAAYLFNFLRAVGAVQ